MTYHVLLFLLKVYTFIGLVASQEFADGENIIFEVDRHYLNSATIADECRLANNLQGRCVLFSDCPSAIQLVRENKRPVNCGFLGIQPIVCCEITGEHQQQQSASIRNKPGELSKQKCNEIISGITTTTPANVDEDNQVFHITVVGGTDAPPMKFKHMAAIGYGNQPDITWACGGTLISNKYILTAAHCIDTRDLGPARFVRLGELDLNITTDEADPMDFGVLRAIKHPQYRPPSVYHDIALIELEARAPYNKFIRPACLHTGRIIPDPSLIATGWGATSYGGPRESHLQEVNLREFTYESCRQAYSTTSVKRLSSGIDDASQLCAGEDEKDTCQGDSGGPLQIKLGSDGFTIVGITSIGKACGIGASPAVYTRVSNYIDWIESIVWPQ